MRPSPGTQALQKVYMFGIYLSTCLPGGLVVVGAGGSGPLEDEGRAHRAARAQADHSDLGVATLERRSDTLLSTLKRFVQATGGEMHIVIRTPTAVLLISSSARSDESGRQPGQAMKRYDARRVSRGRPTGDRPAARVSLCVRFGDGLGRRNRRWRTRPPRGGYLGSGT